MFSPPESLLHLPLVIGLNSVLECHLSGTMLVEKEQKIRKKKY